MAYFIPNDVFEGMNEGVCSEKTSLEIKFRISYLISLGKRHSESSRSQIPFNIQCTSP